jgi:hypothetical protein
VVTDGVDSINGNAGADHILVVLLMILLLLIAKAEYTSAVGLIQLMVVLVLIQVAFGLQL